ncbi:MAG TPA: hypothetical protein VE891_06150 [Allosphingosinicella sp.]|nr:hypothetical protein [Allosphingosinicella sp.]
MGRRRHLRLRVTVSLVNASWIAPRSPKPLILVAHRGLAQQFDRAGVERDTCTATRRKPGPRGDPPRLLVPRSRLSTG